MSDRMAEHYIHLTHSDLEEVLHHVWVAGPGAANPGELLSGGSTPMSREQAQALAVDLSRRRCTLETLKQPGEAKRRSNSAVKPTVEGCSHRRVRSCEFGSSAPGHGATSGTTAASG